MKKIMKITSLVTFLNLIIFVATCTVMAFMGIEKMPEWGVVWGSVSVIITVLLGIVWAIWNVKYIYEIIVEFINE